MVRTLLVAGALAVLAVPAGAAPGVVSTYNGTTFTPDTLEKQANAPVVIVSTESRTFTEQVTGEEHVGTTVKFTQQTGVGIMYTITANDGGGSLTITNMA